MKERENETTVLAMAATAPSDRGLLVRISFYYVGLAILFPYTMIITVTDFWLSSNSFFY